MISKILNSIRTGVKLIFAGPYFVYGITKYAASPGIQGDKPCLRQVIEEHAKT
jgi:hypothetical protein